MNVAGIEELPQGNSWEIKVRANFVSLAFLLILFYEKSVLVSHINEFSLTAPSQPAFAAGSRIEKV